jgi:hypothetical protein
VVRLPMRLVDRTGLGAKSVSSWDTQRMSASTGLMRIIFLIIGW